MAVHQSFREEVKIEGVVISRLMPDEDLFGGLERIEKNPLQFPQ